MTENRDNPNKKQDNNLATTVIMFQAEENSEWQY